MVASVVIIASVLSLQKCPRMWAELEPAEALEMGAVSARGAGGNESGRREDIDSQAHHAAWSS